MQVATTAQVDLIAMTSHGRSGFMRWALGSVAERIVSETPLPLFLVRETTTWRGDQLRRILVSLDDWNQENLFKNPDEAQAVFAEWQADAEAYLQQLAQLIQAAGTRCTCKALLGDVAPTIVDLVDLAASEIIDLLVMCTHGHSGLRRWLYGSVTNKVLRSAACPLLVIHNPPTPEEASES